MKFIVTVAILISFSGFLWAQDDLPEGPGKKQVSEVCTMCHDLGTALQAHHTKDEWTQVLDTMKDRGAEASDEDWAAILAYLTKNFGIKQITATPAKR